jgi:4-hydroxy-tetrahydrodipicolinate synthase
LGLFDGLSAFPPTPADAQGHVQEKLLAALIGRIAATEADSIGLLGSTGGYAYLTPSERQHAVRVAVECLGGKRPLFVGVGALRTDDAQALAMDARKAGADGLLVAPMSYTPLTEEEVFQHMAGELPLCIYNNPGTTKFTFSEDLIARLAKVPHIVAVKMPLPADGNFAGELARLRARLPEDFTIGYSGDWGAADALLAGGDAWFSVIAGLLPAPALALMRAAQAQDEAEVRRIDARFRPLWALFQEFGSFRIMYAVADSLGLYSLVPPRPILPLSGEARARVEAALEALGAP